MTSQVRVRPRGPLPRLAGAIAFVGVLALVASGCGKPAAGPSSIGGETAAAPTATPGLTPDDLKGFAYPIAGGCLPQSDSLMPNAAREYRRGRHEGVDFYDSDNCTPIPAGAKVLAAKGGTVVRADWEYRELTAERLNELYARLDVDTSDSSVLDEFRGRQVWIDHGKGVITRYAHLKEIAYGAREGATVNVGDVVGYVGESGTPESVTNPGNEHHLHFEIWVQGRFLGEDETAVEVRRLYETAFSR